MKILTIIISTVLIQFAYGLTQAEREAVLQAHNNYRSQLAKGQTILQGSNNAQPAKNLYELTYNISIESVAQAWADQCVVERSSGSGFGENLYYINEENISLADALTNASAYWWGEFNATGGLYYQYGFAYWNQSELEEIGDAIQMAWANTTQIGCGVQHCSSYTFVVCNYYQQGNIVCAPVYEVGQACAADNQCTSFPDSTCEVSSGLCQAGLDYWDYTTTWYYLNGISNATTSTSCEISPPSSGNTDPAPSGNTDPAPSGNTDPAPPPSGPSRITIQCNNGRFVSSNNGDQPLLCDRTVVGPWETFELENIGYGKVALKNMGKYVSSENGDAPMTCKQTVVGDWEKFDLVYNKDGTVSLKGNNGKYVSSEDSNAPMICNRLVIGPWEKFRVSG